MLLVSSIFFLQILFRNRYNIKISVDSKDSFIPFGWFLDLVEVEEVVTQLEKQGYSGEEIFKAIHATESTDASILTGSMICRCR